MSWEHPSVHWPTTNKAILAPTIIQDSCLTASTAGGNDSQVVEQAASSTTVEPTLPGEESNDSTTLTQATCADPKTIQSAPSVGMITAFDCIADRKKQDDDIVMGDSDLNSSEQRFPQNDDNLPSWLTHTIKYLRGVSEEIAWQNLVTEFITFEKSGPPAGVSPYRDRVYKCGAN